MMSENKSYKIFLIGKAISELYPRSIPYYDGEYDIYDGDTEAIYLAMDWYKEGKYKEEFRVTGAKRGES